MPFEIGETIGPYRILEQRGQGGMATVYKAYHPSLDRYVALKALHPAFLEDMNFLARFQREARVIARLDHANIVPIYDYAEHQGRPYLVIKYIDGETLKARLDRGPLSQAETVDIIEAVGSALTYAHRQGVLHRDVKPSNVLLAQDGSIYLADFGLARIAQAGTSTLSSDILMGTPQYISPEQAVGKHDLDAGTDIYSFGILLYEILVGRVPFSADTPYAIIHDHIYKPLPLPRQINPQVSEAAERMLLKALAKERSDRYRDIESLLVDFKVIFGAPTGQEASAVHAPPQPETIIRPAGPPAREMLPAEKQPALQPGGKSTIAPPVESEGKVKTAAVPRPAALPRRKMNVTWMLIPVLVFAGVCILGLVGIRAVRPQRWIPPLWGGSTPAGTSAGLVEAAEQKARASPNDAQARLDLALAYWDEQRTDDATREMVEAWKLAGNNPDFYRRAGEQFLKREAWLPAGRAYLEAVRFSPAPHPPDLLNAFHETVYKAYRHPEAGKFIPMDAVREVDPPLAEIARAREELYRGTLLQAEAITARLLKDAPGSPDGRLVQAEILLRTRAADRGRVVLENLINEENVPTWIKEEARRLLEANQP